MAGLVPVVFGCCQEKNQPRNVLFIMVDDLRPSFGCYGDSVAVTPCVDAFASGATVYSNAYCQQALSGPTRASLLTGLRPSETGVTELNTWMRERNPDIVTLPQAFRSAGYETVSVGKTFHGARNTLDSLSWSRTPLLYRYTKNDEYQLSRNKTGKKAAAYEFTEEPEDGYLDVKIRNEAVRQMRELSESGKPFFLAVGFLKPHLPFCAPERFLDLYADASIGQTDTARIKGAPALAYHDSDELRGYTDIPAIGPMEMGQNEALKRAYYACVSFADENIGVLLRELERLGLFDDTVVVLLGDHGYHTGEQGLWCKSTNYEAACRAPLIIRDPDNASGRTVSVPVEFVDIFPTVAGMCGISLPEGLQGKDLRNLDEDGNHYAFSQFPRPYNALHNARVRTHSGYAVRDTAWRYVEWYDNSGKLSASELYYLGGNEQSTHKYISEALGKATLDTNTYGKSTGHSGNYSTNYQQTGRELMTPDEVRLLDNKYGILIIKGVRPILDLKYDLLKHPRIKETTDGKAKPYRHGEIKYNIDNWYDIELSDNEYELLSNEEMEEYFKHEGEQVNEKTQ